VTATPCQAPDSSDTVTLLQAIIERFSGVAWVATFNYPSEDPEQFRHTASNATPHHYARPWYNQ
jgi:hypothetical protein